MSNIDKHAQCMRSYLNTAVISGVKLLHLTTDELSGLLDELEHYKSREERVTKLVLDNSASWDELYKKLEAAEKRVAALEALAFSPAILDVISERHRQRATEGWTSDHDDAYQISELADAAACYAIHAHNQGVSTPAHWPWSPDWWKQSGPRRDLVKAGALILAEIERIDRAAGIRINGEG